VKNRISAGLRPAAARLRMSATCAGVTTSAVCQRYGREAAERVIAEDHWDARDMLGVDREVPVGLTDIALRFELDTDADAATGGVSSRWASGSASSTRPSARRPRLSVTHQIVAGPDTGRVPYPDAAAAKSGALRPEPRDSLSDPIEERDRSLESRSSSTESAANRSSPAHRAAFQRSALRSRRQAMVPRTIAVGSVASRRSLGAVQRLWAARSRTPRLPLQHAIADLHCRRHAQATSGAVGGRAL
jgi:hypothetical protein